MAERLKTPQAAARFGRSADTLRIWARGRRSHDGGWAQYPILTENEHWFRRSPAKNAPILFDVERCTEKLRELGYEVPAE